MNDRDGTTVAKISNNHKNDVEGCIEEMIREYLKKGERSWKHVLKCLRDTEHNNLADSIEKELKSMFMKYLYASNYSHFTVYNMLKNGQ